jgi:hypothetical protein
MMSAPPHLEHRGLLVLAQVDDPLSQDEIEGPILSRLAHILVEPLDALLPRRLRKPVC